MEVGGKQSKKQGTVGWEASTAPGPVAAGRGVAGVVQQSRGGWRAGAGATNERGLRKHECEKEARGDDERAKEWASATQAAEEEWGQRWFAPK